MAEGIAVHKRALDRHTDRADRARHKVREIDWGWGEHVQRTETGNKAQSCSSWWFMYIKHI